MIPLMAMATRSHRRMPRTRPSSVVFFTRCLIAKLVELTKEMLSFEEGFGLGLGLGLGLGSWAFGLWPLVLVLYFGEDTKDQRPKTQGQSPKAKASCSIEISNDKSKMI